MKLNKKSFEIDDRATNAVASRVVVNLMTVVSITAITGDRQNSSLSRIDAIFYSRAVIYGGFVSYLKVSPL